VHDEYQNYEYGHSVSDKQQFVGELTGERKDGLAEVIVKNRFAVGDSLELMTPQGNLTFTLKHLEDKNGKPRDVAPGDGHILWLPLPEEVALDYALLMRNF
jgi:putative protease